MTGTETGMSLNGVPIIPGENTEIDEKEKSLEIRKHHQDENRGYSSLAAGSRVLSEKYTRPKHWDPNEPKGPNVIKCTSNYININRGGKTAMELILEKYKGLIGEVEPRTSVQKIMASAFKLFDKGEWFTSADLNEAIATVYPDFKFNETNTSAQANLAFRQLSAENPKGLGLVNCVKEGIVKKFQLTPELLNLGPIIAGRLAVDAKGVAGKPWHNNPRAFIEFLRAKATSDAAKQTLMPYERGTMKDLEQQASKAGLKVKPMPEHGNADMAAAMNNLADAIRTLSTNGINFNINFNLNK